ncbi:class II aldolase/adducin family protein [Streptomyces sp. NBC_01023]|uniref:class II aldolase/adducin family protein n=1 Tax=unclassified Streptomyces TaxID=2593676 RepID=UPI0030E27423|nr:class II aldolase/adducin family protein [Streptomyces sp. NBC_01023]
MKPVCIREDAELQREHLSAVGRSLYRSGWMPGTFGSVSVRSGEAVMITADGLSKREMTHQDAVMVDPFKGLPLLGETEWPPAETPVHLALYRRLPGCGAVIHAHAPWSTALATRTRDTGGTGQVVFEEMEMAKSLGVPDPRLVVLPVVPNNLDASLIADDVTAFLDEPTADTPPALLIDRNGIFSFGRDIDEARNRLECVEELSHLLMLTGADEPGMAKVNAR